MPDSKVNPDAPPSLDMPLLRATGITKTYGGTIALSNANLEVRAGEVLGLVGENGAGKSTMIKVISGATQPDQGLIELNSKPLIFRGPRDAIQQGIAVVHQELSIAPHLSVAENIALGQLPNSRGIVHRRKIDEAAEQTLSLLGVDLDLRTPAGNLSIARQQIVEIARAMAREVRILMLDEPSTVLGYDGLDALYEVVNRLRSRQVGIVYISHRMPELFTLTDRMTVLRDGEFIATTPTSDIDEETLITQMTGRQINPSQKVGDRSFGKALLVAKELQDKKTVRGADLTVRRGEIVCLTGLVGSGRTEIIQMIAGASTPIKGTIRFGEKNYTKITPKLAKSIGIGYLPESRRDSGVLGNRSIHENVTLAGMNMKRRSKFGLLRRRSIKREVSELTEKLKIKFRDVNQPISDLSGGNQQKVLIARWLMADPDLYIFDEPTRGIDVGTKAQIYSILQDLANEGKGLLVVSSEVEEVLRIADRIVVVREGRTVSELSGDEMTADRITEAQLKTTTR